MTLRIRGVDRLLARAAGFGLTMAAVAGIASTPYAGARTDDSGSSESSLVGLSQVIHQACLYPEWLHITGSGEQLTDLGGQADFEFVFGASLALDLDQHLHRGEITDAAWQAVSGFADVRVNDVELGPGVDPKIWAAGVGIWQGTAGGTEWSYHAETGSAFITALQPVSDTLLAAGLQLQEPAMPVGVYRYDPTTNLFSLVASPPIDTQVVWDLEAADHDTLFMGVDGRGLWRSDDAGLSWDGVDIPTGDVSSVTAIAVDPEQPFRVYIGMGQVLGSNDSVAGLAVSTNDAVSWTHSFPDLSAVSAISPATKRLGMVHAAGWGRGLLYSLDRGVTWRSAPTPPDGAFFESLLTVNPRGYPDCELLYAAGIDGVWVRDLATVEYRHIYFPAIDGPPPAAASSVFGHASGPRDAERSLPERQIPLP